MRTQDQNNQTSLATDRCGVETPEVISRGARNESQHGYRQP